MTKKNKNSDHYDSHPTPMCLTTRLQKIRLPVLLSCCTSKVSTVFY